VFGLEMELQFMLALEQAANVESLNQTSFDTTMMFRFAVSDRLSRVSSSELITKVHYAVTAVHSMSVYLPTAG
jgi:hypothetical protein